MELHFVHILFWFTLHIMCQVSQSWWGPGRQLVLDPTRICKKPRRLKGKQSQICKSEPDIIHEISKGAAMGTKECQHQFSKRRWNCTTSRRSMRKVLMRDSRETGFVSAITAAGVTYAVAQACSLGSLLECSCQRISRAHNTIGAEFDWRGCSDNVDYGYRKSKEFMDERFRKRSDFKTLILAHNYEAGRLAIKNNMRTVCKCHGMSGSCTVKTCWRKLPLFRDVGRRLKEKFDGAAKMMAGNDGKGFIPEGMSIKTPGKEDLVYSEESIDFCVANNRTGSMGTSGRECNATSMGTDGCELLCCGRGYTTERIVEETNCKCRFHYCCEVICETCITKREIYRCL